MSIPKISVIVDYAHEPQSMRRLLDTACDWKKQGFFDFIIHVVSCCGKGRDDWKKPVIGTISYTKADFSMVTTEEYTADENPLEILAMLSGQYPIETKLDNLQDYTRDSKYMIIVDRKQALQNCKELAQVISDKDESSEVKKFLILSTSMGSQQTITLPQGEVKYDERSEWKKLFA